MGVIVTKTRTSFAFSCPTSINFSVGVAALAPYLAQTLGITRVLIITDKFLSETKYGKALFDGLKGVGCNPEFWTEVIPDPTDTSITEATDVYLKARCDGIIAFGGGSHMDTAKAVGVLALNGNKLSDYFSTNPAPAPITKVPPLICMPTTAGTGAEVTGSSVITSNNVKYGITGPLLSPTIALVDPDLTLTLPASMTAATGLDALSHAVEGYVSLYETPITDAMALYAVELIAQNLRKAVFNGADLEARTNMSLAALLGGITLNNCYATGGHSLAHAIGARYHLAHGLCIGMTLPAILEHNRPACQQKLSKLAPYMGVPTDGMSEHEAALAAIEAITQLIVDLDIPTLVEATGMKIGDIDMVAEVAAADGCNGLNPRPWTADSYAGVLKKMLKMSDVTL